MSWIRDFELAPNLLHQAVGPEALVYDSTTHLCHHLTPTAAVVLEACRHQWTENETYLRLGLEEGQARSIVQDTLCELSRGGLLRPTRSAEWGRRQFLQKTALGSALVSLLVPTASAAASLVGPLRAAWDPTLTFGSSESGVVRAQSNFTVTNESPTDDVPVNTIFATMSLPPGLAKPAIFGADWTLISVDANEFVIQYGPAVKALGTTTIVTVVFQITDPPPASIMSTTTLGAAGFTTIGASVTLNYAP